jgi:hypothetical protein
VDTRTVRVASEGDPIGRLRAIRLAFLGADPSAAGGPKGNGPGTSTPDPFGRLQALPCSSGDPIGRPLPSGIRLAALSRIRLAASTRILLARLLTAGALGQARCYGSRSSPEFRMVHNPTTSGHACSSPVPLTSRHHRGKFVNATGAGKYSTFMRRERSLMSERTYDAQVFYQYRAGTDSPLGKLVAFAAPAKEIKEWAGVPRKGWNLRALYQRILDETRLDRVANFFTATPPATAPENLSPTAVTMAITSNSVVVPPSAGPFKLVLPVPRAPDVDNAENELARLAAELYPQHLSRFSAEARKQIEDFSAATITRSDLEMSVAPDDYIALFVADLIDLSRDPGSFLAQRKLLGTDQATRLVDALFELSKPALIVDGQHRVFGAAQARSGDVSFLVCAMPNCSWKDQAFQFVVINEEARPVDVTVLYDIFGSSLTKGEAHDVRRRLGSSGKDVEKRIAAVVAYRDEESPFFNMVQLRVEDLPQSVQPFLSPRVIVDLIDGSRLCRGFRSDTDFIQWVVRPALTAEENELAWSAWYDGRWRQYWYAFWCAVRDYFNSKTTELWNPRVQSNLTKGVSLKTLQDVLMDKMIAGAKKAAGTAEEMRELTIDEVKISMLLERHHIPVTPKLFYERIRTDYLEGFPTRFFQRPWVKSLETAAGAQALRTVLQETFSSYVDKGGTRKYPYWNNAQVFATGPTE